MQHKPQLDRLESFGLLMIGQPKSGKTTACLGFESPIAVLDCDKNFAGPLARAKATEPDFDYFYFDPNVNEDGTERPMNKRWDVCMEFMKLARDNPAVKTILIDSLSPLVDFLMARILAAAPKENFKTLKVGDMELMAQAHWQPFKNYMTRFVTAGRTSGKTFVVTCHEDTITTDTGGVIGYRPMVPGSLKNNLAGFFTDVWRTEFGRDKQGKTTYLIRVAPKNLHQIGNSLGITTETLDVTNKKPNEVWTLLAPYFGKETK